MKITIGDAVKKKKKKHPLALQKSINKFLKRSGVLKEGKQIELGSLVTVFCGNLYAGGLSSSKEKAYVVGFKQGTSGPALIVEPEKDRESWSTRQEIGSLLGYEYRSCREFVVEWERIVSVSNNVDILTMLTHSSLKVRKIAKEQFEEE